VQRPVTHALIVRNEWPGYGCNFVYSVARAGADHLVSKGEFFTGLAGDKGRAQREAAVHHAVDVNGIYFALARTGRLVSWTWAIEIRSQNELTGFGFQKDYDAVVTLRRRTGPVDFALEYEPRPKTLAQYPAIRKAIEGEKRVDRFVYVVHAVVIAEKLMAVEMLRVGHTYDLLIVKHEARVGPDSKRPRLHSEILFRALRGHLPLDLIGKDRELAGTIAPEFFTSSGERREIPSRFSMVVKAITRAVNCVDCAHPHFVVPQACGEEFADDNSGEQHP